MVPFGINVPMDKGAFSLRKLSEEFLTSALACCILQHDSKLAIQCLTQGEDPHLRCKNTGCTLLHLISLQATPMTQTKYVPLIYVFSNIGVDLDLCDNNDVSPLQKSIRCGLLEIMTSLLKCGATVRGDEEHLAVKYGGLFCSEFVTALRKLSPGYWHAVEHNKTFRVNVLAKSWCRINLTRKGQTLIEFAKQKAENPQITLILIRNEASIEFAHATMAGDKDRMRYLLCNGSVDLTTADLSYRDNFFVPFAPLTLYGSACKYGHRHLLPMLKHTRFVRDWTKSDGDWKIVVSDENHEGEIRLATDHEIHNKEVTSAVCTVL